MFLRDDAAPNLGELEAAVLEYLWAKGEAEAKGVHASLGLRRGITLNTIQSTLKRLFEKGLLTREKVSHAHLYRPALDRAAYHARLVDRLVGELRPRDAAAMLHAFVELTDRAGPEHLAQLEALVAARRRERGGR